MKTNKNGVKLLATLMVLAVAFAGTAVIIDGSDADATESSIIKFSDSAVVSISNVGTSYVISGFVPKSTSTTVIDGTNFVTDFGNEAIGYGYAILDKSIVGGVSAIVQKNSALELYDGDENISGNDTDGWVKTSNYEEARGNYDLNFLIPADGSVVTFDVTKDEETITYTFDFKDVIALDALDSEGFLALKDKDSVVKLEKDYIISGPVQITSDLTVTMNGHSLYSNGDMFAGKATEANCTFTINGDDQSKMIVSDNGDIPSVYYQSSSSTKSISLDVNGGYYEGVYTFSCGTNAAFGGTVTISDATVVAKKVVSEWSEGIWTSYGGFESVTIERTNVESDGIGIYLGVQKKATLTDVTVESDGTAVEVKSGTVSITGGSLHSNTFVKADGTINQNGTGDGEATLNINNGYEKNLSTPGTVSVTVDGTKITNSSGAPIQICAGTYDANGDTEGGETACLGNITFTSKDAIPLSDLSIVRYAPADYEDEREISVNIDGQAQDIETKEVTTDTELKAAIEGKDYSSITLSNNVTSNVDIKITQGQTVSVSTNGNKITATIKNSDNNNNVVKLDGVVGNFVIGYGSIQISGDFDEGNMTVYGDAYIIGNTTIDSDVTLNIANGANLTVNEGYTLDILGTVISNGNITNNGTIEVEGTLNSWGEFNNTGDLIISGTGTVRGIVKNSNGSISISSSTPMTNLQIIGGDVATGGTADIPIMNGSTIEMNEIKYTAYRFDTADGVTIIIGVPQVQYNGDNYAGKTVTLKPLQAYLPDGDVVDVKGSAYSNSSKIYQFKADAEAGNGDYKTCIDAGNYYVRISAVIEVEDNAYGTVPVDFVAEYPILKKNLNGVAIYGEAFGTSIKNQNWKNGDIIDLTYGTDYNFYLPDGSICRVDPDYFEVDYNHNDAPGTASIIVTFKKNYTTDAPVQAQFEIVQGLNKLDITVGQDVKFHVGQKIDPTSFTITGVYEDSSTTIDATIIGDVVITKIQIDGKEPVSYTASSYYEGTTVTLTFESEYGVTGTYTLQVVQIDDVIISGINSGLKTEYNAGEKISLQHMTIEVKYADETSISFTYNTTDKKFDLNTLQVGAYSNDIEITPEVFNTIVGNKVPVTATYFGVDGILNVKVNGYGIIYVNYDGETEIAWQCGLNTDTAFVYNYNETLEEGYIFLGWSVENTDSSYMPGTGIRYGQDTKMWGDDNTLYLYAIVIDVAEGRGTVGYDDSVVKVTTSEGDVVASGDEKIFDTKIIITPTVVPAEGETVIVKVNDTILTAEKDGTYVYIIDSKEVNITVTTEKIDFDISDIDITVNNNGKEVTIIIYSENGYIPAGEIVINYTYTIGKYQAFSSTEPEKVDAVDGNSKKIVIDMSKDVNFSNITYVSAEFVVGDESTGDMPSMEFTPVKIETNTES